MGRKSAEQLAKEKQAAESKQAETENKETGEANTNTENVEAAKPLAPNTGETVKPETFKKAVDKSANFLPPLRRGEVLIAVLDKEGNEIAGHSFVTTEQTAATHYADKSKFIIKKKAK